MIKKKVMFRGNKLFGTKHIKNMNKIICSEGTKSKKYSKGMLKIISFWKLNAMCCQGTIKEIMFQGNKLFGTKYIGNININHLFRRNKIKKIAEECLKLLVFGNLNDRNKCRYVARERLRKQRFKGTNYLEQNISRT